MGESPPPPTSAPTSSRLTSELPDAGLTERGRRELVRDLEAEQGFAHRVLPLGTSITLQANGNLTPKTTSTAS